MWRLTAASLRRALAQAKPVRRPFPSGWTTACAAAGVFVGVSASQAAHCDVLQKYEPPPRFDGSFANIRGPMPWHASAKLAWSVKNLEAEKVAEILEQWPRGASLLDRDNNTLFHLLAHEAQRCETQPDAAKEVLRLLLHSGWEVVDMKNSQGHRADVVADSTQFIGKLLGQRSSDWQEPLRIDNALELVGDVSPVPFGWEYPVQDERRRSFAGVAKRAVPVETCQKWMKDLTVADAWTTPKDVPRKTAWFVSEECADCPYRYSGLAYPAAVFPPFMEEIRAEVCRICGIPEDDMPNSCNVNLYSNHNDDVGWHSDDEVYFQSLGQDTRILSFSLGAERDFCWRMQGTTQPLGKIGLGDGDLMTMEGLFQKHYKHSVPRSNIAIGPRANFTFRWIRVKAHAEDASTQTKDLASPSKQM